MSTQQDQNNPQQGQNNPQQDQSNAQQDAARTQPCLQNIAHSSPNALLG